MKRIFITSIVALALVLGSAGSAQAVTGYVFSNYLTVGSTGADVSALQGWLISSGFDIPAISSGAAQKGYFGQQTKAAVVNYQASVGLPNTGFVGPLTVAKLNGTAGTIVVTANCPTGYTCTATAPVVAVNCPVGYTCTANPGTVVNPVVSQGVVTHGTDGSVTVSLSSYASNATIKKGETKDMVAVKLQATAAPVAVTRFDVRFNNRPWLYFGQVTLKDSTGVVIATKNLSSSADATEITVGSDYLVRFEGINVVITPGTDRTLVVSGSVLSTTDKLTSDVSVIVSIPDNSIRTLNGKGYTDSIGLGTVATSGTSGRTMTLSSSGSTGNIVGRINPSTPLTGIIKTSTNGETVGVVIGKFDFKSENRASTINTLTFTLKNNQTGAVLALPGFSTLYKRLYITDGVKTVQVDSVATSSVFSNLTFDLPQDKWVTLSLIADVADADDITPGTDVTNPVAASSTITINTTNVVGIDSNFTTVTASGANAVTSNDLTFLESAGIVLPVTGYAPATAVLVGNGQTKEKQATIGFNMTFKNNGGTDLYISKVSNTAFATSSTVAIAASSTLSDSLTTASPSTRAGDSSTVWIIPSGTERSFFYTGILDNTNTTGANHSTSITKVYFDDDTSGLQEFNIDFGLEAWKTPVVNIGI